MRTKIVLVLILALAGVLAPVASDAQPPRVARIGYLVPIRGPFFEAFREGLRSLGYVEGQNIVIELRSAEGSPERLPALASELVRLKVDVIVASSPPAPQAAKNATGTIPIVFAVVGDPVGEGLVASLARPGGNITGLTSIAPEIVGKQLELLREVVPKVSRATALRNPDNHSHALLVRQTEGAARALGMQLQFLEARSLNEIERAFSAMAGKGARALLVLPDPTFVAHRARIADLAARSRLPAMYGLREEAEAGGLMAYGPSRRDMFRRAATYVDKILKGAKPADLPVEQPTRFELVISLKTAKALGLTIPESVLIRADEVIK